MYSSAVATNGLPIPPKFVKMASKHAEIAVVAGTELLYHSLQMGEM